MAGFRVKNPEETVDAGVHRHGNPGESAPARLTGELSKRAACREYEIHCRMSNRLRKITEFLQTLRIVRRRGVSSDGPMADWLPE
jgi:hypothetical protein